MTTARDLTILGRSLEERFPRYFRYFSTAQFDFDGEIIGNHNHLLGRIDGVDGIKTGYTRASGFNLLTSVHRDGRSLLAVVMGGRSAAGRDRIMANLIGDHIAEASTAHTATAVADASPVETRRSRATNRSWRLQRGRVRLLSPKPSLNASPPRRARRTRPGKATMELATRKLRPRSRRLRRPSLLRARRSRQPPISACSKAPPSRQRKFRLGLPRRARWSCRRLDGPRLGRRRAASRARFSAKTSDNDGPGARAGWMIQIGAPDNLAKANALLSRARERNRSTLASAKPRHRKGAQRRRHPLPRAFRRPGFGFSGSRVPLAQTHRIFLLHRPRLTRTLSELPSLDAASEHPWPD